MRFRKGHGTGNDFVVIPDADGAREISADQVARICDRRRGLGADGILRVVRWARLGSDGPAPADAEWFMDYRNADGSVAEMCGNGARVFARFLVDAGWAEVGAVRFGTRGGVRTAHVPAVGDVTIEMGRPARESLAVEPWVTVMGRDLPATPVHIPNPHAVVFVEDIADAGDLLRPPVVGPDPVFPDGVNVEFVQQLAEDHIRMRVHERGVGETLSCGTGACAAAVVHAARTDLPERAAQASRTIRVDVPGGTVWVTWQADGEVLLTGPAEFVAEGDIDEAWLTGAGRST